MVRIVLSPEGHRCLLEAISDKSPAVACVKAATTTGASGSAPGTRVITCSFDEALALLWVAARKCPEQAAEPIRVALIQSLAD